MSEYAFRVSHVQSPQKSGSASLPRAMKSGNSDEMFKVAGRAIVLLSKFLKLFLSGISKMMQAEVLINFAKIIPETLYMIRKNLGLQKDSFIKNAVCLKCKTLYNFDECVCQRPNGEVVSAKCSHVSYPRHPYQARRRPCGSVLMKTMRSRAGKTFLYPKQVYCFTKVTDSLQDLINEPNFMENCEKWRNCSTQLPNNVLGDCFEGRVSVCGQRALSCHTK